MWWARLHMVPLTVARPASSVHPNFSGRTSAHPDSSGLHAPQFLWPHPRTPIPRAARRTSPEPQRTPIPRACMHPNFLGRTHAPRFLGLHNTHHRHLSASRFLGPASMHPNSLGRTSAHPNSSGRASAHPDSSGCVTHITDIICAPRFLGPHLSAPRFLGPHLTSSVPPDSPGRTSTHPDFSGRSSTSTHPRRSGRGTRQRPASSSTTQSISRPSMRGWSRGRARGSRAAVPPPSRSTDTAQSVEGACS
jgi:hypothetical protein